MLLHKGSCGGAHIADVPGLIAAGDGDFVFGIAHDKAVLRAVLVEPGGEVFIHLIVCETLGIA